MGAPRIWNSPQKRVAVSPIPMVLWYLNQYQGFSKAVWTVRSKYHITSSVLSHYQNGNLFYLHCVMMTNYRYVVIYSNEGCYKVLQENSGGKGKSLTSLIDLHQNEQVQFSGKLTNTGWVYYNRMSWYVKSSNCLKKPIQDYPILNMENGHSSQKGM